MIDEEYKGLLNELAEINLLKSVVNISFKREFEILQRYEDSSGSEIIIHGEAFGFDNPFAGSLEKYAFRTVTLEKLKQINYWHKNSQYCWLLMCAYEKFEKFLNSAYFFEAGDYSRDLNTKLCYFSKKYPDIKEREFDNYFKINLRIAVHLVEKMRHHIVHNQGLVNDSNHFINNVISKSGIASDRAHHEAFVSQFIVDNRIFILEVDSSCDSVIKLYQDQYRVLVSYLISYAYLIKDAVLCSPINKT